MDNWISGAIQTLQSEQNRSADTHLIKFPLPALPHIHFYLKDESTHPTGSLKHRLARSLFLYALCNGYIHKDTTIIEASSGSTAVSEAYFAQLLDLPFIAVMPSTTSIKKIKLIEHYQGQCHLIDNASLVYSEAQSLAKKHNGYYMDQFTFAERATDWRGNNNIAESLFAQMEREPCPIPSWVVIGAGTGGTSATIGRYITYKGHHTKLCVPDPEHSVFYDYFHNGDASITHPHPSNIEGIGRPRVEPSFVPSVIDRMLKIPDAASFATLHFLQNILHQQFGASTGTNIYASFQIINDIVQSKSREETSIVSFICDDGTRYIDTVYNEDWLEKNSFHIKDYIASLLVFYETGVL